MEHFEGSVTLSAAAGGIGTTGNETHECIQVLFDSLLHSAPPGTRSTAMSIREIVYRADPYQIDVQVEAEPERGRLVVTGQLLDLGHPQMVGLHVPVTLSNLHGAVMQTRTNQFGEFRGELENAGDLELSFLLSSGKPLIILLRGARQSSSGARG